MKVGRGFTVIGLVTEFHPHLRCDKCDFSLEFSMWNDTPIVFSTNKKTNCGYVCVKCVVKPRITNNGLVPRYHQTPEELDEFIKSIILEPIPV